MSRTVLDRAGDRLRRARAALDSAMQEAERAGVAAVRLDGQPEAAVARALGVDRMTLRKWLGKR